MPIEPARKPGTTEPVPPPTDPDEFPISLTVSPDSADAESHVARAVTDSTDDTTTHPVKLDADENPEQPKQTTEAESSPAESGTEFLASPQDHKSEAAPTKFDSGRESQARSAPFNNSEKEPLKPAAGQTEKISGLEDPGCFEPLIPQCPISPAPEPAPEPKPSGLSALVDKILQDEYGVLVPKTTPSGTGLRAAAEAEGKAVAGISQAGEIRTAPVRAPLPPPRMATADELFSWIKRAVLAQTYLAEDAAELVAFWVISTWFQDVVTIHPCLVITGPAHEAAVLLRLLRKVCREAAVLAGFRRADFGSLPCRTKLILEPNLNKQTAGLLGSLTDHEVRVAYKGGLDFCSRSAAIYTGENPRTHPILNSIHIHIAPTNTTATPPPPWLDTMLKRIPLHLKQYRDRNLDLVRDEKWVPSLERPIAREMDAIATALGSGIVGAPALREKLLALLETKHQRHLTDLADTIEARAIEAIRALRREGREQAYAKEVAIGVNGLLEARGETMRLSPEKIGHVLKRLGLPTRALSSKGNGLVFDKATVAKIEELALKYVVEDAPAEAENLHGAQATEKKPPVEVVEVVEEFSRASA